MTEQKSIETLLVEADRKYAAVCSQIGEAQLTIEALTKKVEGYKVEREVARAAYAALAPLKGKYVPADVTKDESVVE